jgi:tetratricopeptide (TPR) repeat protein
VRALALASLLVAKLTAQGFPDDALALLAEGKVAQARRLAEAIPSSDPAYPDALLIQGTATLYDGMVLRPDETIYHPTVDLTAQWNAVIPLRAVVSASEFWSQIPALDPKRSSVWDDLSSLYFDAGNLKVALANGRLAAASPQATAATLKRVAYLAGLAQAWPEMVTLLSRTGSAREAQLYRTLELWRTGDPTWKTATKAFLSGTGPEVTGSKLIAYLAGDKYRDNEAGLQELLRVEPGFPNLIVKHRYADRFPELFTPRLDLARNLAQYGNYDRAIELYVDMDRRQLAKTPDEKAALALNQAWAWEAAGRYPEATNAWQLVVNAKDFYARSAACWFLGRTARENGKLADARSWWTQVADEPARSKYAAWCATELKRLN